MIDEDTLIDLRMVYVDVEHAFGPHRDAGCHKSSKNSIALHLNAWASHDYVPRDNKSGPWMECIPRKNH